MKQMLMKLTKLALIGGLVLGGLGLPQPASAQAPLGCRTQVNNQVTCTGSFTWTAGSSLTAPTISATTGFRAPVGSLCTAGTIGYSYTGDTDSGWQRTAANTLTGCVGAVAGATLTATKFEIPNASVFGWVGGESLGRSASKIVVGAADLVPGIDNNATLGTAASRWLATYALSNYVLSGATAGLKITAVSDGVGQASNFAVTGLTRWVLGTNDATANGMSLVNSGGNMLVKTGDGSLFIRIKPGEMFVQTAGGRIGDESRGYLAFDADGVPALRNNAGTGITRLVLGANDATTNGGAIALTSGTLDFVNGNNTAYANTRALSYLASDFVRATTALQMNTAVGSGGSYLEGWEQSSDPAAPSTNEGRLFFKDNGSGKTQGCIRFPTGATQCFATEP
jgi:hypothetical protein